jgi:EAL domain-containing protein (putative c-di-GMP-specific phosphodiesterase class I)
MVVVDPSESATGLPHSPDWSVLLREAMGDDGVRSEYQPVVDLARGSVVGYEGLARFAAAPGASPVPWFDAARARGCLARLEAVAMRSALAGRGALPPNTFLTVNVGPDVIDHPEVREVLDSQPSLAGVVIELTEYARVDSYPTLARTLDRLRSDGALIAIDDAGSGYAGLQHLLGIRPDIIKLDRNLVAAVDRDEAKRALIEMIGTFASRVDAWVLAEGVETAAELETLARLGVPLGQGYYLARPGDEWPAVSELISAHLRSLASQRHDPTLRSLVEHVPTASSATRAADVLRHEDEEVVVVLDGFSRPVATLGRRGGPRSVHGTHQQINVETPVAQAAQRAVTRPVGQRFAPLVCIDDAGRFVGLVRMERVMDFLAARVDDAG